MRILIDIPEEAYELLKNGGVDWLGAEHILNAVANGTPVPTDAVDRVTIKEYLESFGTDTSVTTTSELSSIRHELLERKDELVSFGQLIERFDDVDAEYGGSPWTLKQIYANFNMLMGIESVESLSYNGAKTELSGVAVDRQAVLDVISELNAISFYEAQEDSKECYYEIRKAIKQLPSVTPQPCEDAVSRQELLKSISTWDKFGCDADTKLVPYKDHYVPYIHYDDVINCINGMPSVSSQPCGDCISREYVIKLLENTKRTRKEITNRIYEVPSVTPQPNMGRWLIKRVGDYDHAICSVCGDDSYLSPEWDALELYKYCPNCGSKMQEVEE